MMGWSPRYYILNFVKMVPLVLEKEIFLAFFSRYGHGSHFGHVTRMLQTNVCFPPLGGSIENLALIGQVVWEKKMFEIVDGQTDGWMGIQ